MNIIPQFLTPIITEFQLLGGRDLLEICIISSGIYYFLRWLSYDKEKNLAAYVVLYGCITLTAYYTELPALFSICITATPIVCCSVILFHQHLLQRNFIALKKITSQHFTQQDWLDSVMQTTVHGLHTKKSLVWIFERKDSLGTFIQVPYVMHAEISRELLKLVTTHDATSSCMWVSHEGKLLALDAQWNIENTDLWLTPEAQELSPWQQQALCASVQTDCIIFASCPTTQSYTLIHRGMIAERLNAAVAHALLRKVLHSDSFLPEGVLYATHSATHLSEQQLS